MANHLLDNDTIPCITSMGGEEKEKFECLKVKSGYELIF